LSINILIIIILPIIIFSIECFYLLKEKIKKFHQIKSINISNNKICSRQLILFLVIIFHLIIKKLKKELTQRNYKLYFFRLIYYFQKFQKLFGLKKKDIIRELRFKIYE